MLRGWPSAFLAALLLLGVAAAGAVEPDEILDDPALEARARAISAEVRCLVCQNQSIDSSNADLARELRILVRERLVSGDSDNQVKAYLVDRYGDFVLFRPPLKPATYLLWFGPLVLFVLALAGVLVYLRGQGRSAAGGTAALTAEEEARLSQLLDRKEDTAPGKDGSEAGEKP